MINPRIPRPCDTASNLPTARLKVLTGCVACVALVVEPVFNGYALSILWGWLIVPLYDAPALDVPAAIGLTLVFRFVNFQYTRPATTEKTIEDLIFDIVECIALSVIKPAVAIACGWMVTLFH